jgi:hypothetical protein
MQGRHKGVCLTPLAVVGKLIFCRQNWLTIVSNFRNLKGLHMHVGREF